MNNLWNRSVGPFDEAAVQRHRHMGLLDCNGDVNADAVNFLAHLCAGLWSVQQYKCRMYGKGSISWLGRLYRGKRYRE